MALREDHPRESVREILRESSIPLPKLILMGVEALFLFGMVKVFGRLAYSPKYLVGKWYSHFWSPGWRWAFNGMFAKLFAAHGRGIPWPIAAGCSCGRNIVFHVDDLNNFQGTAVFQTFGDAHIVIGHDVWIARGCSIITTNHDQLNPREHVTPKSVCIHDHCWLGTNVCILPGVTLGEHTVVGAGAVVTHSFNDGYCVLGGVPAKVIKHLPRKDLSN